MNNEDYLTRLNVLPSECSCEKCKRMCHSPCFMSVEDAEKLIEAGYAKRLMFDDLPSMHDTGAILKPALKGYEGEQSPWATGTIKGCTFWTKDQKCALHKTGLKPIQGRIAIHDNTSYDGEDLADLSKEDWESERGLAVIEKWKKIVGYTEETDE